jgi:hypothetical protein
LRTPSIRLLPFSFLSSFASTTTTTVLPRPPRVLHGARCHPHPWHLSPLPKTFYATRLLSPCFRRLWSRSFAQDMVEKRGCTACGGRASSSGAYEEVGADRGPSRVVSLTHLSRPRHKSDAVFLLSRDSIRSWAGADIDVLFSKGIPRTDSFTLYVRLSCHLSF